MIVGEFTRADGTVYTGQATLNNVEFVNCGQRGFTENYDPRYSLAFLNVGNAGKESSVTHCSFNYNYNTAFGVFGTNKLVSEGNIVYRALGKGIEDAATGNKWHYNLVSYVLYEGIHLDQPQNFNFHACFQMEEAYMPEMIGNIAAGCERGGIMTEGEPCDSSGDWMSTSNAWYGNEAHGTMHGIRSFMKTSHKYGQECASFNNFFVWNAYDYGIYLHIPDNITLRDNIVLDSGNGLLTLLFGPPSLSHKWTEKYILVNDSLFVGTTNGFDCDANPPITYLSSPSNWPRGGFVRSSGIVFPSFGSKGNWREVISFHFISSTSDF